MPIPEGRRARLEGTLDSWDAVLSSSLLVAASAAIMWTFSAAIMPSRTDLAFEIASFMRMKLALAACRNSMRNCKINRVNLLQKHESHLDLTLARRDSGNRAARSARVAMGIDAHQGIPVVECIWLRN